MYYYIQRTVNNCAPPLLFDSRFESGNLQKAIRIDDYAYFLQLKCDLNTNGHVQWFFFQVKNMQGNHEYQFTLGNFTKPKSLFNNGMKVLVYSKKKKEKENIGWYRTGYNISYTKNKKCSNFKQTYLLDMSIVFTEDNDTCYIAYCYPYTYSDLQRDINILKMDNKLFNVLNHEIIGESINKNKIDLITITNNRINNENKKVIIITGRVHPCETNSSFMVKGFIEFMIGNTKEAQYIRDNYIVKIIPMLNPDGVISGNSRCSLTGYDLNRCWRLSEKKLIRYTPEIHTVIKMIEKTLENNSIEMFVDMHGHSRKFGTFLYGCSNDDNEDNRYKERIFPYIFSNYYKQYVYFNRCHFNIEKVKEGTGRVTMHKKYNVLKSYTMEASMCGSDLTSTKENE
ncbi:Zn-dependent exopeptidase [Piromyces finnis]|uniref:Zn-dependent exopeptidase n=1 Tax=Piromyces finnis TaxID=1754191 RepID=A0A1Y1VKC3_9FUNG|nr:Zn-dependent exopeptidase [Piromyces finnis]|eukprot:ORX58532.1 Zn-dependent exopeptidase [Piromyces finnis]